MQLDNAINNLDNVEQIDSDLSALSSIDSEINIVDEIDTEMYEVVGVQPVIDAELSLISENPVQNKVITGELNSIKETYATKDFVEENGGKIDSISVNGTEQEIVNKNVNIDLSGYVEQGAIDNIEDNIENLSKEIESVSEEIEGINTELDNVSQQFSDYAKLNANQTFTGNQTVVGNLVIEGSITQKGEQYITEAEKVVTEDDYILMRKGATGGLGNGYSGFEVENYNGNGDNARLVVDGEGTARVGDVGDEQPLLTRKESEDLSNGEVLVWNSETNRAEGNADYVKNTDYATSSKGGVGKISDGMGVNISSAGVLYTVRAVDSEIIAKASSYKVLTPSKIDIAIKTGITTNTIELTEEEKTNAQTWLGVTAKLQEIELPTVTRLI